MKTYAQHPMARQLRKSGIFLPAKTFADIERRITSLKTTKERGDAFEIFAEGYLATQKVMSAAKVWVNTEIPVSVLKKLNIPRGGAGIDGIYGDNDGRLIPYQVKFREGRPNLTLDELGGFYALSSQAKTKLLFTNTNSVSPHAKSRSGYISVRGSDLDRLTPAEIGAICAWARGEKPRPEKRSPRPYQEAALKDITRGLDKQNRATAVMACGTGKTFVALWAAERQKPKTVLVLLPSLALLSQTLKEWALFTTWGNRFHYLCVCSDPSVSKGGDEWSMAPVDLNFRVGTDPKEVRRFLAAKGDAVRVVFSTYQSSRIVAKGMKGLRPFDFGIFDEAHKTAGREGTNFSFALKDKNLPIRKRLFLTATPRHYDIRKRNKEGDFAVTSMDDEQVYGPVVHKLTFGKAADQGIICRYKVIISVIDSDTLDREGVQKSKVLIAGKETYANWVATQLALKRAVRRTSAKRIITFHRDVKAARTFAANDTEGIKSYLPNFTINHVNGTQSVSDREASLKDFKEAERGLITNARCLTEGVDVPSVDMVAFMSPRKSRVDIVQAVGRAMRKADGKKYGYLLVPLFLERRKGETLQQAFERSDFDEVAAVINAMQEQDEDLAEIIRELKKEKGRTGGISKVLLGEKVEVLGPLIAFTELRSSITASIVERLGSNWDEMLGRLVAYRKKHGDCNVPQRYRTDPRLGRWVAKQRSRSDQLSADQIKRLKVIGFVWDLYTSVWEAMFGRLITYKREHGDCNVPRKYNPDPQLGTWVAVQRSKRDQLPADQINRLEEISFHWIPRDAKWEKWFGRLITYKREHGDCNVPQGYKFDLQLGTWVAVQRSKRDVLDPSRRSRLETLGFVWGALTSRWEEMFGRLATYKREHGDCNVPPAYNADPQLGVWVGTQRQRRKRDVLDESRWQRLGSLGFDWDPFAAQWEEMFERLITHKREHGDCNVPQKYKPDSQLGTWVAVQRRKRDVLDPSRRSRLETLGFVWDALASRWEEMFGRLATYKREHGDCNVPDDYNADPQLGTWVGKQRSKGSKLSADKIQRLETLGFVWDPPRGPRK